MARLQFLLFVLLVCSATGFDVNGTVRSSLTDMRNQVGDDPAPAPRPVPNECALPCLNGICQGNACHCRVGWKSLDCSASDHDATYWVLTVLEILAILPVGLFSVVAGYRIVPLLMFFSGFTFFSFTSYQVLWNLASPPVEPWLNVILSFGVGLLGGMIFASVRKYAIVPYAFIVGCFFGSMFPATPMYPHLKYYWVPLIFILFFGVAAVYPMWRWEQLGIMIGSAFCGSFMLGLAVDNIVFQSPFSHFILHYSADPLTIMNYDTTNWMVYTIEGGILVVTLFGSIIQYYFTARGHENKWIAESRKQEESISMISYSDGRR